MLFAYVHFRAMCCEDWGHVRVALFLAEGPGEDSGEGSAGEDRASGSRGGGSRDGATGGGLELPLGGAPAAAALLGAGSAAEGPIKVPPARQTCPLDRDLEGRGAAL